MESNEYIESLKHQIIRAESQSRYYEEESRNYKRALWALLMTNGKLTINKMYMVLYDSRAYIQTNENITDGNIVVSAYQEKLDGTI